MFFMCFGDFLKWFGPLLVADDAVESADCDATVYSQEAMCLRIGIWLGASTTGVIPLVPL